MKSHTRRLLVDYRERILFPFQGSSATCLNWNSMPQQFEVPTSPQLGWFLTNGFAWVCHVFFQGTCRNESTFMSLSRLKAMNMGLPAVSKWSRMVSIFWLLRCLRCHAEQKVLEQGVQWVLITSSRQPWCSRYGVRQHLMVFLSGKTLRH